MKTLAVATLLVAVVVALAQALSTLPKYANLTLDEGKGDAPPLVCGVTNEVKGKYLTVQCSLAYNTSVVLCESDKSGKCLSQSSIVNATPGKEVEDPTSSGDYLTLQKIYVADNGYVRVQQWTSSSSSKNSSTGSQCSGSHTNDIAIPVSSSVCFSDRSTGKGVQYASCIGTSISLCQYSNSDCTSGKQCVTATANTCLSNVKLSCASTNAVNVAIFKTRKTSFLSTDAGKIAGAVVGALLGAALIIGILWYLKKRSSSASTNQDGYTAPAAGGAQYGTNNLSQV